MDASYKGPVTFWGSLLPSFINAKCPEKCAVYEKNTPDHKVHFTPSSDEALDYLASKYQEENLPNLILLDIKLIRGNGLDLLNDLKISKH